MKRITLMVVSVVWMAGGVVSAAQGIVANSKITTVIVYSDRAMVTRVTSVELQPGTNEVKIEKLPPLILEESLRAGGKGTKVKIVAIQVEKAFLERSDELRIRSLEDEIRRLGDRDKSLLDKASVLESKRKFLESFGKYSSEKIEKEMALQKMQLQTWKDALKFMTTSLNEVNRNLQALAVERRSIQEKLQALRKELNEIRRARPLERKTVTVTMDAEQKGKCDLEISYVVMGARWSPVYDARALMVSREVQLAYRAAVSQKTGEDWDNVELVLSTARPVVGARAPELPPWYIRIVEPVLRLKELDEIKMRRVAVLAPSVREKAEAEYATPQATMTSMMFRVLKRESVPGNGSSHKVTIAKESLKPVFEYITVPKVTPLAFLRTEVMNSTGYTFLPGPVNVFQDIDYVGKSRLKQVVPGDTFSFELGVDENIKCKRDLIKRKKEFLLFGKERITYTYRITVESFKQATEMVTVVDQVPVSQDERVTVKVLKTAPKQEPDEKGIIEWRFPLEPKEKKEIELRFCITYPKGMIIGGLR